MEFLFLFFYFSFFGLNVNALKLICNVSGKVATYLKAISKHYLWMKESEARQK